MCSDRPGHASGDIPAGLFLGDREILGLVHGQQLDELRVVSETDIAVQARRDPQEHIEQLGIEPSPPLQPHDRQRLLDRRGFLVRPFRREGIKYVNDREYPRRQGNDPSLEPLEIP